MKILILLFLFLTLPNTAFSQPLAKANLDSSLDYGTMGNDLSYLNPKVMGANDDTTYRLYSLMDSYKALFLFDSPVIKRQKWITDYLTYLSHDVPVSERVNALKTTGDALFSLFPEYTYDETLAHLAKQLKLNNLATLIPELENVVGISKPTDCKSFSLLNVSANTKSLHSTNQNGGTCYAHAAVKALDYLNYSTGFSSEISSAFSAAIVANLDRESYDVGDIDGGHAEDVIGYLQQSGGCRASEFDNLSDFDYQRLLSRLTVAKSELYEAFYRISEMNLKRIPVNIGLQDLASIADTVNYISRVSSFMTPETQDIFYKALRNKIKYIKVSGPLQNSIEKLNAMIDIIDRLSRHHVIDERFGNAFANAIIQEAYCGSTKIKYAPSELIYLRNKTSSEMNYRITPDKNVSLKDFKEMQQKMNLQFSQNNPQPFIASICTRILTRAETYLCRETHSLLITGQKYDHRTKQCSYQFLNSWGKSPTTYYPWIQADKDLGALWIPGQTLEKNMFSLFYLKPKNSQN